jgi:hypothetical protein
LKLTFKLSFEPKPAPESEKYENLEKTKKIDFERAQISIEVHTKKH